MQITLYKILYREAGSYAIGTQLVQSQEEADQLYARYPLVDLVKIIEPVQVEIPDVEPEEPQP